jgi:hypothetical protein
LTSISLNAACVAGLTVALACTGAVAGTAPAAGSGIAQREASAFATSDGHLMYSETHWLFVERGRPARLVLYRCPDGAAFARKLSRVEDEPQAPDFQLDDGRTGYREGVRHRGGAREVFVRKRSGAAEQSARLDSTPLPVIDAGFDAYIRSHWDAPAQGGVPFVLPSRLGTLNISIKRLADTRIDGRAARQYRLSLASWVGFALPHTDVAYDAQTRDLLRFIGMANIRGNDGDSVRARIVFDPARAHAATAGDLDAARRAPLDGRCPIP